MKRLFTFFIVVLFCQQSLAQTCEDFAVELSATVQVTPPQITLSWKRIADTTTYAIYKKAKTSLSWPSVPIATLPTADSTFTDTAVIVDSAYEYQVIGSHQSDTVRWIATGYIYAGIKCPAIHNRGAIILMVDSNFTDSCAPAIYTLMKDLSGDGWQVIRHDVARTLSDTSVKALIQYDYSHNTNVTAVQLLGHIAVPYSGDLNPDGHPNHLGAWPADVYYAQLTAAFTDVIVDDTSAGYPANFNVPGDGKWDRTRDSTFGQLEVSRVDFYNMPSFTATESQLMNSYLARDHGYKMDSIVVRHRALISDNFGVFSTYYMGSWYYEAFASCGWRNFPPLVSRDSFGVLPFISSLNTGSYQWAYGCGGGYFQGASGIGATTDFAANNINGIFTMLFGSYFGDWNVQDNFMRAPLCSNVPALTCCWAGRPYWFFHQMALGENIGYCAWLSQNNDGYLYGPPNIYDIQQWVHEALMGDLSLRSDYILPPSNLAVTTLPRHGAALNWTASPGAGVIGYYVYRSDSGEFATYNRLNTNMLTTTTFSDTIGVAGLKYYMVRPVTLQSTPSGAYYNLGIGITDTATVSYPRLAVEAVASNIDFSIYPDPATNFINITIKTNEPAIATLNVVNINGQNVATSTKQLQPGDNNYSLQVSMLPAGVYYIVLTSANYRMVKKWVKL